MSPFFAAHFTWINLVALVLLDSYTLALFYRSRVRLLPRWAYWISWIPIALLTIAMEKRW